MTLLKSKTRKVEHKNVNDRRCHRYKGDEIWVVCEGGCENGLL